MRSIGGKIAGSFGIALILLLVIGVLAFWNTRVMQTNTGWVIHTHQVIETLEDTLSQLENAETGQRGYIITRNASYLEPYTTARRLIPQRLQQLRVLTKDNPAQGQRLDQMTLLTDKKLVELQQTIDLRKGAGGFQAAYAVVITNAGQNTMDQIRRVVADMEREEQRLLAIRTNSANASTRGILLVITIGMPLAILLLFVLGIALTRNIAVPLAHLSSATDKIAVSELAVEIPVERRRDEIGALQQGFRNMQQRVQERTAALEASNEALRRSEERFRLMIESVKDYAIILLDPMNLARISRMPMHSESIDLSRLATDIAVDLHRRDPDRQVDFEIPPALLVQADRDLIRIALAHLLDNAWKFTSTRAQARIAVGMLRPDDTPVFFVRDNGVGFDMTYVDKLFQPFHRLHTEEEFPGTGIGLALVQRIMQRHGGRIWAEGTEGQGATFYFIVGEDHA